MGVKAVNSIPNWSRLANYPPNACRQLRMELTLICAYEYIHDEEYLKKIGWHDYKRKLLSELRVAEGYENLLSFNHSLIKGISIIPRHESSKILFPNFLIFTRGKFINRINLSKKIQYLSRKSLFWNVTKCQLFSLSSPSFPPSLPPFQIFYILSTINRILHAVTQRISPHSRDDNPFAESWKRGGGQQQAGFI